MNWTLEETAKVLNRLTFVRWDRLSRGEYPDGSAWVGVFGWIDRDDGRSDFVALHFYPWGDRPAVATSSAAYSQRISDLVGDPSAHADCERVEDVYAGLVDHATHA